MSKSEWLWEETVAGRPGMSGDLAKLFRHEEPKAPGVLALGNPSAAATLLAREVIQNSWDAAHDLRTDEPRAPQFGIEFRFDELAGKAKEDLVDALALDNLASRVSAVSRAKIGLAQHDCLDDLQSSNPLRVLTISESGASGMYGPWRQNKSHMFLALLSIGFTEKPSGAGGSYGYGKAGLVNGSRIRSVLAYSCFRARKDDPGVTRRLLGVTYWGAHDFAGVNHPGIGTFSNGQPGSILPFENDVADGIAERLGIPLRDPAKLADLGTTFMLIDSAIDPRELLTAIERSWWPAIIEGEFVATVIDCDGSTLIPRPMRDPVLHSFIDAWEMAVGRSSAGPDEWLAKLTGPDGATPHVGSMALVADMSGWSYATSSLADDDVAHRSLIALTRSPKMVVEYLDAGRSPPFVRGVFIADPSIDDLLRQTEPKAHDSWRTKDEDGELAPEAAAIAKHVIQRIKQTVTNHRNRLKPPTPPPEEVNLPFFNEIMRKIMSGMGKGTRHPVPDTRPISIRLEYEPRLSSSAGQVEIAGSATFSLSDHFPGDRAIVRLMVAYRFIEDERVGDYAALHIVPAQDFTADEVQGSFTGFLDRNSEVVFQFVSAPYNAAWSGRLIVNGEIIREDE